MNKIWIFLLLWVPGMTFGAICKTVGAGGETSFLNVPGVDCPAGTTLMDYPASKVRGERVQEVDTGVSGRQVPFAGYSSVVITSPQDGGTVRNNEGKVLVTVATDPGILAQHFITAHLGGKSKQGRYGSGVVEFVGVDRGQHTLFITLKDSKGKVLIESEKITFTLQKNKPNLVVNPITGDDLVNMRDPKVVLVRGSYTGNPGTGIYLRFPVIGLISKTVPVGETKEAKYTITTPDGRSQLVTETYNWQIEVPLELLASEASFEAVARTIPDPTRPEVAFESKTTSTHSVDPRVFDRFAGDTRSLADRRADYLGGREFFEADRKTEYRPTSSTAGRTNPAFGTGTMSTPGQNNPAFGAGSMSTPGRLNPAYRNPAAGN